VIGARRPAPERSTPSCGRRGTDGVSGNPQMKDLGTLTGGNESEAWDQHAARSRLFADWQRGACGPLQRRHAHRHRRRDQIAVRRPPLLLRLRHQRLGKVVVKPTMPTGQNRSLSSTNGTTVVNIGNLGGAPSSATLLPSTTRIWWWAGRRRLPVSIMPSSITFQHHRPGDPRWQQLCLCHQRQQRNRRHSVHRFPQHCPARLRLVWRRIHGSEHALDGTGTAGS